MRLPYLPLFSRFLVDPLTSPYPLPPPQGSCVLMPHSGALTATNGSRACDPCDRQVHLGREGLVRA